MTLEKDKTMIKKSNVREFLSPFAIQTSLYEQLNEEVEHLLIRAKTRAESNNRRTVMSKDL